MLVTSEGFEVLTVSDGSPAAARARPLTHRPAQWPPRRPRSSPAQSRCRGRANRASPSGGRNCAMRATRCASRSSPRPTRPRLLREQRAWSIACCAASGPNAGCRRTWPRSRSAATAAGSSSRIRTSTCWCCCPPTPTPPAAVDRALLRDVVGHRHRAVACGAHARRMRDRDGRRRHRPHEPAREPLPVRRTAALPPVPRSVRRADGRARVLRGKGARAAAAAPEVPGRDLQPRAQRQGEPRRPARPADGALDHRAPQDWAARGASSRATVS